MKSREVKRAEAEERNAKWQALSTEEKLAVIATRSGSSKREVKRLAGGSK